MKQLALTFPGGTTIEDPQKKFHNLGEFVTGLYDVIFLVATFVALYWLTWGIFEYIFAGGDKQKLESARKRLTWAIVGLIFVALAYWIAQFAGQVILPNTFQNLPIFSKP